MLGVSAVAAAQEQVAGSIRGVVTDADFDSPVPGATVAILELEKLKVETSPQGNYVFPQVPPGTYTLVFAKPGYVRQLKTKVVVSPGKMQSVSVELAGEFTDMEEFVAQDLLALGGGSEAALLGLRFKSPALMDSIGADLMSRSGASDAAGALRLVAGATVQDGRTAVIRGLPDRYVSSQMNGVRLPTTVEDKRAVELDQFPAAIIESVQVSKTFTPDQQGDASGGAVNVVTKSIPEETTFSYKLQTGFNSQVRSAGDDWLTYEGGGVNAWGKDDGSRAIQTENIGGNWEGAVGTSRGKAPTNFKGSVAGGHRHTFKSGVTVGGYANLFYKRNSTYYDNGVSDSYWVETPGDPMVPQKRQEAGNDDFKTALFDVTQGSTAVQLGGLATLGVETENHSIGLTFLNSRTTQDKATLATDTRGKEYFFPGYNPDDPSTPGHSEPDAAPYLRLQTLNYTERTTTSLQLHGQHKLTFAETGLFGAPELDWTIARSTASLNQPDKRQFAESWVPARQAAGITVPPQYSPYKPAANFTLGNLQRIYKNIDEDSTQYFLNLKLPFEQWAGEDAYLKFGLFNDQLDRTFNQDSFSNFGDNSGYAGSWNQSWSEVFPYQNHPITESTYDVDYTGEQKISAFYGMVDLPLLENLSFVGGARFESTKIGIVNDPEEDALWYPPGSSAPVQLNPGDADVSFSQDNILPALSLIYDPTSDLTLRASYSQTVARQTFKELTPILQQEFLGGPIFIGNPDLQMSQVHNYDLRADYRPFEGGLLSASYFYKDITDPIEYVQVVTTFNYTTARNYPKGWLSGFEFEARQDLGYFLDPLEGLTVGGNATFLQSQVTLPEDEQRGFELPNIQAPTASRDMTGTPDHLFNLYATYDLALTGTRFGVFFTVKGDTLVAGAAQAKGNYVPDVYARQYDTLNVTVAQRLGDHFQLQFQGKNLTNPLIQTVYRSAYVAEDTTKTSFSAGIEWSLSIGGQINF